jgi:hypothetical protein
MSKNGVVVLRVRKYYGFPALVCRLFKLSLRHQILVHRRRFMLQPFYKPIIFMPQKYSFENIVFSNKVYTFGMY